MMRITLAIAIIILSFFLQGATVYNPDFYRMTRMDFLGTSALENKEEILRKVENLLLKNGCVLKSSYEVHGKREGNFHFPDGTLLFMSDCEDNHPDIDLQFSKESWEFHASLSGRSLFRTGEDFEKPFNQYLKLSFHNRLDSISAHELLEKNLAKFSYEPMLKVIPWSSANLSLPDEVSLFQFNEKKGFQNLLQSSVINQVHEFNSKYLDAYVYLPLQALHNSQTRQYQQKL